MRNGTRCGIIRTIHCSETQCHPSWLSAIRVIRHTSEKRGDAMAARILVIDDTQAHLDLFRLILEAEAYDVQVASSSFQNAVDIEQLAPDLIILDYHLNAQSDEEP